MKFVNNSSEKQLLLLSILALFCELLVIRWLSTEIRIFAYFKNLPLMSAFLGLGLGFIWANKKQEFYYWSQSALLCLCALLIVALPAGLTYLSFIDPDKFMLWGVTDKGQINFFGLAARNFVIIAGIFILSSSVFVGLGQRMGKLFGQIDSLKAYSINILGGLLGIILFSLLSYLRTSPGIWLICAGILFLSIERRLITFAIIIAGLVYSLGFGSYLAKKIYHEDYVKTVWSPYYRIDVSRFRQPAGQFKGAELGYNIYINYDSFQSIIDCTPTSLQRFPKNAQEMFLEIHNEPFHLLKKPGNVLILASGTGSDVATAVRAKETHIDAVEIDPCIVQLGKELHPEQPYANPNVSVHVTDARNFLNHCKKKYDLIIFAALDSHAAFSSVSSLRMDNYVFTEEAMKEAVKCLSPTGIIFNIFIIPGEWLWDRHAKTLAAATNSVPIGYQVKGDLLTGILFAGPGVDPSKLPTYPSNFERVPVNLNSLIPVSTDDWPFLFLPKKQLTALYAMPIVCLLLIAFIPIASQCMSGAKEFLNWQMFTLGVGFMLLEVFAMAKLSLLCGSTWTVNSVTIAGVMIMILLANWLALRLKKEYIPHLLTGLLLFIILAKSVNAADLSQLGSIAGLISGTVVYLLPMFFAATIFALLFKHLSNSSTALAFNLMGGVIGICLEYFSMVIGVNNIGWLIFGIYLFLFIMMYIKKNPIQAEQQA